MLNIQQSKMTEEQDQMRQQDMRVYVDALANPPNSWGQMRMKLKLVMAVGTGQHIIDGHGPSHHYLDYLNGKWGKENVTAWLAAYYDGKEEVK